MTGPGNLERDGFQVTQKVFVTPEGTASLDSITKRSITICNLFANHELAWIPMRVAAPNGLG